MNRVAAGTEIAEPLAGRHIQCKIRSHRAAVTFFANSAWQLIFINFPLSVCCCQVVPNSEHGLETEPTFVTHVVLRNWRNFRLVNVPLRENSFLLGPNASGKSNLLDVFRFLRDISKPQGGGLQKAIKDRGGISKLRCLHARRKQMFALK